MCARLGERVLFRRPSRGLGSPVFQACQACNTRFHQTLELFAQLFHVCRAPHIHGYVQPGLSDGLAIMGSPPSSGRSHKNNSRAGHPCSENVSAVGLDHSAHPSMQQGNTIGGPGGQKWPWVSWHLHTCMRCQVAVREPLPREASCPRAPATPVFAASLAKRKRRYFGVVAHSFTSGCVSLSLIHI